MKDTLLNINYRDGNDLDKVLTDVVDEKHDFDDPIEDITGMLSDFNLQTIFLQTVVIFVVTSVTVKQIYKELLSIVDRVDRGILSILLQRMERKSLFVNITIKYLIMLPCRDYGFVILRLEGNCIVKFVCFLPI